MMLDTLLQIVAAYFVRIVSALIILLMGFIIGKCISRLLHKVLMELELDALYYHLFKRKISLERMAESLAEYGIYIFAIYLAVQQLGLVGSLLYAFVAGIGILLVLSLAVGIRDFFPNVAAFLKLRSMQLVGRRLRIHQEALRVVRIGIMETRLEAADGDIFFLPNAQLLQGLETAHFRKLGMQTKKP